MKTAFLLLVLGAVQDRASVEAFLRGYDAAVVANDPDWTLAHTDSTALFRTPSLVTYREIVAHAEWLKAKRPPSMVASCRTVATRIEVRGARALVDFTTTIRYQNDLVHEERWQGHAILTWKEAAWKLWRLDERAIRPKG